MKTTKLLTMLYDGILSGRVPGMRVILIVIIVVSLNILNAALAQNPIVPGKGLCDPQVRIYNNKAWPICHT